LTCVTYAVMMKMIYMMKYYENGYYKYIITKHDYYVV